jgi:hypothetical protein
VDKVAVDVEESRAVILGMDEVAIPKLVVKGLGHSGLLHCRNPEL